MSSESKSRQGGPQIKGGRFLSQVRSNILFPLKNSRPECYYNKARKDNLVGRKEERKKERKEERKKGRKGVAKGRKGWKKVGKKAKNETK